MRTHEISQRNLEILQRNHEISQRNQDFYQFTPDKFVKNREPHLSSNRGAPSNRSTMLLESNEKSDKVHENFIFQEDHEKLKRLLLDKERVIEQLRVFSCFFSLFLFK